MQRQGNSMAATSHDGHRKRMRERYRQNGLDGFSSHEIIELLLFYCHARGDVNGTAHALVDVFGSLGGVLEASPEQLMSVHGIGEESATLLSMILPLFRRYTEEQTRTRIRIDSYRDVTNYCRALMAGLRHEEFHVICLSADGSIICSRKVTEGTLTALTAYPRLIVEAILTCNAHSVIFCHNHPGGLAQPSTEDIRTTRFLQQVLEAMEIVVLDHVIVAGNTTYSMGQHSDMLPPANVTKAIMTACGNP